MQQQHPELMIYTLNHLVYGSIGTPTNSQCSCHGSLVAPQSADMLTGLHDVTPIDSDSADAGQFKDWIMNS